MIFLYIIIPGGFIISVLGLNLCYNFYNGLENDSCLDKLIFNRCVSCMKDGNTLNKKERLKNLMLFNKEIELKKILIKKEIDDIKNEIE